MSFSTPEESIGFAKEAFSEFIEVRTQYIQDGAGRFKMVENVDDGIFEYKFALVKPIPPKLSRLANEALLLTKRSFDQSLYAAVVKFLGRTPKKGKENTNFPWAETPDGIETILRTKSRAFMPDELKRAVKSIRSHSSTGSKNLEDRICFEFNSLCNQGHSIGIRSQGVASGVGHPDLTGTFDLSKPMRLLAPHWDHQKNEMTIATGAIANAGRIERNATVHLGFGLETDGILGELPFEETFPNYLKKANRALDAMRAVGS